MTRAIAESLEWSAPSYEGCKAVVYLETEAGEAEGTTLRFTARVVDFLGNKREVLYEGDSLPAAVDAVDRRLADAEASGGMRNWAEQVPRRMDLREVQRQFQLVRQRLDEQRGVSRPLRRGPIEKVSCPLSDLEDVQLLRTEEGMTGHMGEIYAATHDGRPAICLVEVEATSDPGDHQDGDGAELREGEVTVYASADERLLSLAGRGIYPGPSDRRPLTAAELPAKSEHIEGQLSLPNQPEVGEGAREEEGRTEEKPQDLRDVMREQYWLLGHGRGTEENFEQAYRAAEKAIRRLPCKTCDGISWPVISKPEAGSAEWLEDPFACFACRKCGYYLGHVGDGTASVDGSREWPFSPPRLPSPPPQATM